MFSGLPQATKSRKFAVERDKDSHTLCNFYTDVDGNLSGSASTVKWRDIKPHIKQLSSHSLAQKCPMTYQDEKLRIWMGNSRLVEWTYIVSFRHM